MSSEFPSLRGTVEEGRQPLVLLAVAALVCVASVWDPPAGRFSWLLEVTPGLVGIAVLAATFRRFPMSRLIYVCVLLHLMVLIYGGVYTYAETPLGNWAREAFGLSRNHYDRVGHLALGFFPALVIREVLLRLTPLQPGGWLVFLISSVALAIGAFWELIEWWVTLLVAGDVGQAFLGTQGDVWDAQWDMFLVLVGALIALATMSRLHDRSMTALVSRLSAPRVQSAS
jgi:putative membrane protein